MVLASVRSLSVAACLSVAIPTACSDDGGVGVGGAGGGAPGTGGSVAPHGDPTEEDRCSDTRSDASCETTCGIENAFPDGASIAEVDLECSTMSIPLPLRVGFTVIDEETSQRVGDARLFVRVTLPVESIDLLSVFCYSDVAQVTVEIVAADERTVGTTTLAGVPCNVCLFRGAAVEIDLEPVSVALGDLALEDLSLGSVTLAVDFRGLEIDLTTSGDTPTCSLAD